MLSNLYFTLFVFFIYCDIKIFEWQITKCIILFIEIFFLQTLLKWLWVFWTSIYLNIIIVLTILFYTRYTHFLYPLSNPYKVTIVIACDSKQSSSHYKPEVCCGWPLMNPNVFYRAFSRHLIWDHFTQTQ